MKKVLMRSGVVLLMSIVFALNAFGAEPIKIRYVVSIYADDKGAAIRQPEGVACNDKSAVIIADSGNGRLVKYTYQEGTLQGGAEIKTPSLLYPIRVQVNSKGEILVLDGKQRKVARLAEDGTFKSFIAPAGPSLSGDLVPRSFKIDANDNIYILDISSQRVVVLDPAGNYVKQIGFPADYGFVSDLAVNAQGTVFLLDSVNSMVYSAAKDSPSFSPLTKSLKEYMNFSVNMTTDGKGMLYLADQNGSAIVIIGQDGSFQGRHLGLGWKDGLLHYPAQLCINGNGDLFIADRENNRIQIFSMAK